MGKFLKTAERTDFVPPVKAPDICSGCKWDFERDNHKKHYYDKHKPHRWRVDPRQQINTPEGILCDVCHDKKAFMDGTHANLGTPMERLWRDALWPERAKLEAPANVALENFAKRYGT